MWALNPNLHVVRVAILTPFLYSLQVMEEDGFPSSVCYKCMYSLESFHDFYESTMRAQTALHMKIVQTGGKPALDIPPAPMLTDGNIDKPNDLGPGPMQAQGPPTRPMANAGVPNVDRYGNLWFRFTQKASEYHGNLHIQSGIWKPFLPASNEQ